MSEIAASISISLGTNEVDSSGSVRENVSAKAEVCGSGHKAGDEIFIKVFLPAGYTVGYIANSMEGIGGCKVVDTGQKKNATISEDLKFADNRKEASLGYQPIGSVTGQWMGISLGTVGISGMTATLGTGSTGSGTSTGSTSGGIAACDDSSTTNTGSTGGSVFTAVKRGVYRVSYTAEAKIYKFISPSVAALQPFGAAPYAVDIEFQCKKGS